jgi:glutaconate CoA-transferase, subunit A
MQGDPTRRKLVLSKIMTMKEAISRFVHSGNTVFIAGMRHGEPSAAAHEIVRQRIDHLTLVCCLTQAPTLLIAEGLVDKMIMGQIVRDEKRSYALTRAREMGRLPIFEEYSHFGVCLALLAGQLGIPYIPTKCQLASDILKYNPNLKEDECPFTGEKVAVVKAIVPDVGLIHVQRADAEGNAQKWGSLGLDREGINASTTVIVTTEKLVDVDVIRTNPNMTIVPGFRVSAVVEQPWGAYPTHLAGHYHGDTWNYNREVRSREGLEAYLRDFIYGVEDWNEYLRKRRERKGENYFENLRVKNPVVSEPVISGY